MPRTATHGCRTLVAVAALSNAICFGLVTAGAGQAAQTTLRPTPDNVRTFATDAGGWTTAVTYGGTCVIPGVTCAEGTASYQASEGSGGAGDGHLRNSFQTVVGVATDVTITRTSPSFSMPTNVDRARLSVGVRSNVTTLLALLGGSATYDMVLRDNTVPASSQTLAQSVPLTQSAAFTAMSADVQPGTLDPSHTYSVVLRTTVRSQIAALATTGAVDIDDVQLRLVDLEPPTALTASTSTSGPLTVNGSVNPAGQSTAVTVQYGPQGGALTNSTTPVEVTGATGQPFSIPLPGLEPGTAYDYRVVAQNADGSATTATASFTAPTPPANSPPTLSGATVSRQRTATYTPGPGITAARVEILNNGTVVDTVTDPGIDGEVNITLPNADGSFVVRVVREATSGSSVSTGVTAILDRLAPSLTGANLQVSPVNSSDSTRNVTFSAPTDAVSAQAQAIDSNGDPVGPAAPATGGTAEVQLGNVDGTYRVRLTVFDAAGNSASVDSADLLLDSTAPSAGGAPLITGAGNSRTRQVGFDRDLLSTSAQIEVLDAGGQLVGTVPVLPLVDTGSITLPDSDGTYQVRVRQSDLGGNEAVTPATQVTLDRVAPAPGSAPTVAGPENDRARVVSFQRDPATAQASIEILDTGGNRIGSLTPATGSGAPITLPNTDGDYVVRVLQTDWAGNQAPSPGRDVNLDRQAPNAGGAPSVTGPPDALTITFVRAPDATSARVEILDSSGAIRRTIAVTGNTTAAALPPEVGAYTIRVVQTDAAGNSATSPPATRTRDTPGANPGGFPANQGNGGGGFPGTGARTNLTDPGRLGAGLAACLGGRVALTDVAPNGNRVQLSGVSLFAAGTTVALRDRANRTVATTRTDQLGRFSVSARLPGGRARKRASYQAVVAGSRSLRLKLGRRNRVSSLRVGVTTLTLSGILDAGARARLRRAKRFRAVVVGGRGAAGCRSPKALKAVGKPKVNRRTGRYRVTVGIPAGPGRLVLRTRVLDPLKTYSQFVVR